MSGKEVIYSSRPTFSFLQIAQTLKNFVFNSPIKSPSQSLPVQLTISVSLDFVFLYVCSIASASFVRPLVSPLVRLSGILSLKNGKKGNRNRSVHQEMMQLKWLVSVMARLWRSVVTFRALVTIQSISNSWTCSLSQNVKRYALLYLCLCPT